ncbi:BON domain-containing protein [Hymenobacter arizonensis]|nr:BON domain-containing protein [Hymenobacter arizonensis]
MLTSLRPLPNTAQPAAPESLLPQQPDEALEQAVRTLFRQDPQLPAFEARVQAHHGVVTLVGVVGTLRTRQAAEEKVRRVAGVWHVHNLLKVRPSQPRPAAAGRPQAGASPK